MRKFKSVIFSIWFLALIIAVPALIILLNRFDKYNLEVVSVNQNQEAGYIYFHDLNADGEIEKILSYRSTDNMFSFQCSYSDGILEDQYNFPKMFLERLNKIFFHDIDNNGYTEVFGFTVFEDSVFLSYVEPFVDNSVITTIFITTISTEQRQELDVSANDMLFADLNNDGYAEAVFSLGVGYNWFPRKIYACDFVSGILDESENYGVHFSSLSSVDTDADGNNEILCIGSSAHNIPAYVDVKYRDIRPRMFLFNADLTEKHPPIEFSEGIANRVKYFFVDQNKIIVNQSNTSQENQKAYMINVDLNHFRPVGDTLFYDNEHSDVHFFKERDKEFVVFSSKGNFLRVNDKLEVLHECEFESISRQRLLGVFSLENIGLVHVLEQISGQNPFIYFDNLKRKEELVLSENNHVRVIKVPNKPNLLVISDAFIHEFEITKNNLFFLLLPNIIGIYLFSVFFIWIIQYSLVRQIREKIELQNQVHDLQLKTLKNQLDPHFIFNTFNTIASVIKQGRNEEAYDVMVLFSKLLRQNMDNSNDIFTSLKSELGFVRGYLSIQKYRFRELFDFEITVEKNVNTTLIIPKMLLQIHIENALKHGIIPLRKNGILSIYIKNVHDSVQIVIEDNGIGRKKSQDLNMDSSKIGLKALDQIIQVNNKNHKNNLSQKIIDLYDKQGNAAGTRIEISVHNNA